MKITHFHMTRDKGRFKVAHLYRVKPLFSEDTDKFIISVSKKMSIRIR